MIKTLKINKQNIDETFKKTSIKMHENSLGLREERKHEKSYIKLYIQFFGNAREFIRESILKIKTYIF